ncbi:ribonuclease HII [Halothermothrix orenii]|uniref:Ribonuclease HII n=1 Tax=Halothermothrix orenii (strain H 168 / OCM 544 / DSM 9562) TaxID=373903 RepID=B8CW25_HALOH|nr:ribonuclease HII [Halothermothrix orenii]ACL69494.1 Ribonuclease H [Halothermothrix orenii H 168]
MDFSELTIKEIDLYLKKVKVDDNIIKKLEEDPRKGVKKLATRYKRIREKEQEIKRRWEEMNSLQNNLFKEGFHFIAGVDEAGRGPLAGPVVAAAVVFKPETKVLGLDDSKKLTAKERETLFEEIYDRALSIGVGIVDNKDIDKLNILNASLKAMKKALDSLSCPVDYILIDGKNKLSELNIKQQAVIDGDNKVNVIAAASIIAKVTRDRILDKLHKKYPEYGFINNKGYGTREHIEALKAYGPSPIHRYSFSLVREYCLLTYKERLRKATSEDELIQIGKDIDRLTGISDRELDYLRNIYRNRYREIK